MGGILVSYILLGTELFSVIDSAIALHVVQIFHAIFTIRKEL
jgi:hypothetical protein